MKEGFRPAWDTQRRQSGTRDPAHCPTPLLSSRVGGCAPCLAEGLYHLGGTWVPVIKHPESRLQPGHVFSQVTPVARGPWPGLLLLQAPSTSPECMLRGRSCGDRTPMCLRGLPRLHRARAMSLGCLPGQKAGSSADGPTGCSPTLWLQPPSADNFSFPPSSRGQLPGSPISSPFRQTVLVSLTDFHFFSGACFPGTNQAVGRPRWVRLPSNLTLNVTRLTCSCTKRPGWNLLQGWANLETFRSMLKRWHGNKEERSRINHKSLKN